MNPSRAAAETPPAPVRTCLGCRRRVRQSDLLRVVAVQGRVMPDPRRQHSGRGAYVHPARECVAAAIARRAFGKALRAGGPLDTSGLEEAVGTMSESNVGSVGMTTR